MAHLKLCLVGLSSRCRLATCYANNGFKIIKHWSLEQRRMVVAFHCSPPSLGLPYFLFRYLGPFLSCLLIRKRFICTDFATDFIRTYLNSTWLIIWLFRFQLKCRTASLRLVVNFPEVSWHRLERFWGDIDPDGGHRGLCNVGFQLNIDRTDRPRRF
jgi:hypothetical protein